MEGTLAAVAGGCFGMLGGCAAMSCKGMAFTRAKNFFWKRFWRNYRGNVRARQVLALLDLLPTDFPEVLGPIRLFDVPNMTMLYDSGRHRPQDSGEEDGRTWKIWNFRLLEETGVAAPPGAIDMHMTEEVEVLFGQIRRKHLGLPEDAAFFRWCYPCRHTSLALDANNDDHLAVACLLETGGWMYFDNNHNLLAVKTITPAQDYTADTMSFKKHAWRQEWTTSLAEGNRFHPITLDFMLEADARYFVWLKPNERIGDGDEQPIIPHGGFAYLFHEPNEPDHFKSKLDCYFAVKPFSSFPTLYKHHRRTDGDPRMHHIEVQVRFYLTDPRSPLRRNPGEWLEIQRLTRANCMRRIGGTEACIIEAVTRSTDMEVDDDRPRVRCRLPPNAGVAV